VNSFGNARSAYRDAGALRLSSLIISFCPRKKPPFGAGRDISKVA
jgi:hypothetical protein